MKGVVFLRVLPVMLVLVAVLPDTLAPDAFANAAGVRDLPSETAQDTLDRVTVQTAEGLHVFRVELADEPHERSRGLMFRKSLPEDGGMLFDNGEVKMMAMWMKNTFIPLDMIFISNEGRIVTIVENTTPFSTDTISSGLPVRAVLEVRGGTAARLGIRPGDRVEHPMFDLSVQ
jgi:uncharacterized membrane protein (UPF0127 family)